MVEIVAEAKRGILVEKRMREQKNGAHLHQEFNFIVPKSAVCVCARVEGLWVGGCLSVGREGVGNGIKVSAVQSKHTFLQ